MELSITDTEIRNKTANEPTKLTENLTEFKQKFGTLQGLVMRLF